MSYDSDASFDDTPDSFAAAPAPDSPASAAMLTEAAVAMAAASSFDSGRPGEGWDAPPPSTVHTARAFTSSPGWTGDDDNGPDSDWDDRGGNGRRAPGPLSMKAQALRDAALRAYTLHPDLCQQSTAEVAHQYGRPELDGRPANRQVAAMHASWRELNPIRAAAMADEGTLVIAGRAGSGNSGHTAIVVPGTPVIVDGKPYPYVCGGGLPMRRSDGNRTAADTWTASERAQVRYFTPETRGWFRRLFGL